MDYDDDRLAGHQFKQKLEYPIMVSQKDRFFSKGKNTPFHGEKCFGKIKKTFVNGKLVFEEE